jgi:hypothetical protein
VLALEQAEPVRQTWDGGQNLPMNPRTRRRMPNDEFRPTKA